MPMKLYVALVVVLVVAVTCRGAEERTLSVSPNKQVAIVEERGDSGKRDYYFVQQPSRKKLGFVLPPDQRNEISNVGVVASWNATSTKVALVVSYSTKLSELLLYSRTHEGVFHQVNLQKPDPIALYQKQTGKPIPQPGDGYSQNAVGPWLDESTVALISGEAKQTEDMDLYLHVFVTFRAHFGSGRAELSQLKLHGPLADGQSTRFMKGWGEQYH